jgi:hypothetical protein
MNGPALQFRQPPSAPNVGSPLSVQNSRNGPAWPKTPAGEVYLKLTVMDDVLIVAFKEL